jgi:TatD family-associated radical SAM protein
MIRYRDILDICRWIRESYHLPVRINTNGQGNLIAGEDITPELAGLVDAVSISLNAANAQEYDALCRSDYGEEAYRALLDFAVSCKTHVPRVTLSVVNVLPPEDIVACRQIAERLGVEFKVRSMA